jgi:hypothetical protein
MEIQSQFSKLKGKFKHTIREKTLSYYIQYIQRGIDNKVENGLNVYSISALFRTRINSTINI